MQSKPPELGPEYLIKHRVISTWLLAHRSSDQAALSQPTSESAVCCPQKINIGPGIDCYLGQLVGLDDKVDNQVQPRGVTFPFFKLPIREQSMRYRKPAKAVAWLLFSTSLLIPTLRLNPANPTFRT
jgi:hypothetical protein